MSRLSCQVAKLPSVLSAMLLSAFSPAFAADTSGNVTEPEIISPNEYSRDVSAFYLGLSAGYGAGGSDRFGLDVNGSTFPIGDLKPSGNYGGIRGGWRGVLPARGGRDYVYGIEFGYDIGTLKDSTSSQIGGTTVTARSEISDVFSVRLKNGLTNRSRSVLYFVTVGYVQGDITTANSLSATDLNLEFEDTDRRKGFSASLGAEHQLSENWSITGEFEYVQFESQRVDLGSTFSTKSTPNYRGFRFGLNYTF